LPVVEDDTRRLASLDIQQRVDTKPEQYQQQRVDKKPELEVRYKQRVDTKPELEARYTLLLVSTQASFGTIRVDTCEPCDTRPQVFSCTTPNDEPKPASC
jgi:hypothetical protein